jgi:transcriptional regulator with XRE-family HTH domain
MTQAHGQWLREQRQARGWSAPETARQLRIAARSAGDKLPDNHCLVVMIYRWEDDRGGISERYRLHYCRALGIPAAEFGRCGPKLPPDPSDTLPADTALMLAEAALMLIAALQARGIIPDLTDMRSASDLAGRIRAAQRELDQSRH